MRAGATPLDSGALRLRREWESAMATHVHYWSDEIKDFWCETCGTVTDYCSQVVNGVEDDIEDDMCGSTNGVDAACILPAHAGGCEDGT